VPSSNLNPNSLASPSGKINILVVEDDLLVAKRLINNLTPFCPNYEFHHASSFHQALDLHSTVAPAAAVVDLSLSEESNPEEGLNLIRKLVSASCTTRVIVLTGESSGNYGLKCLHAGATSFNQKPAVPERLRTLLDDAVSTALIKKTGCLSQSKTDCTIKITSAASSMSKIIELADFAAQSTQPLIITGETGTGKGWLARKIHSAGARKQFVRYQPTFTSSDLVNSELFGHEKGSFTGASHARVGLIEMANNGSLFIDEVDSLSNETQVLLLETLQEQSFRRVGANKLLSSSFRLITASNQNLKALGNGEVLRKDFFHRVSHIRIDLPALRNRKEDIIPIAESFLKTLSEKPDSVITTLSNAATGKLSSHTWPGNIRELLAVVESAAWLASYRKKSVIDIEEISFNQNDYLNAPALGSYQEQLRAFNESIVLRAMKTAEGNQTEAARLLGLDRSTFRRLLRTVVKQTV